MIKHFTIFTISITRGLCGHLHVKCDSHCFKSITDTSLILGTIVHLHNIHTPHQEWEGSSMAVMFIKLFLQTLHFSYCIYDLKV